MNMEVSGSMYVVILSIVICLPYCLACDGYKIINQKLTRCTPKGEDIFNITNVSVVLNDDCTVKVYGCLQLLKQINSVTAQYTGRKDFLTMSGTKDVCTELENGEEKAKDGFAYAKVSPAKCPFKPMTVCGPEEPYPLGKYKRYLRMAKGKLSGDVKLITDAGELCFKASATIVKETKG